MRTSRIGIIYPSDPAGHVPSGVDSFIRGLFKWAPDDLEYTLIGATSDTVARPVGRETTLQFGSGAGRFIPIVEVDARARRGVVPLTVRYMWALQACKRSGRLDGLDVLDFHRIEQISMFVGDPRPKNVILHTDMSILRDPNCEIMWRHAPGLYEFAESRLFRELDRVYSVRQSAVERYRQRYPQLAERFVFTNTWVDTEVFRPSDGEERMQLRDEVRRELGVEPTARLVTFVGRLDRSKDPQLLLGAFNIALASVPDAHLVLVGDGILRPEVEARIAELGLARKVTLAGARQAGWIARLHRAADLFALSSLYEGMPIALLEALATGLPVASTRVGEVARVVVDGSTGRIASARTAEALADAIVGALAIAGDGQRRASVAAIGPHRPEAVLGALHENHRRQVARRAA